MSLYFQLSGLDLNSGQAVGGGGQPLPAPQQPMVQRYIPPHLRNAGGAIMPPAAMPAQMQNVQQMYRNAGAPNERGYQRSMRYDALMSLTFFNVLQI